MENATIERAGLWLIILISLTAFTSALTQTPVPQDPDYLLFKDARNLFQIPNFWNVLSNIPFLFVGLLGLYKIGVVKNLQIIDELKPAYFLLFAATTLVSLGSGYFHLWPDNQSLVWDRLPMTIAFMSLFSIIISEFISIRAGKLLLIPLIIAGLSSVVYWQLSESWGAGDLRFYALIQFLPILLIPVILICYKSRFSNISGYWWLLAAYFVAKLLELFDGEIYNTLGFISGHSLKHVAAAIGVYVLLYSYEHRNQLVQVQPKQ